MTYDEERIVTRSDEATVAGAPGPSPVPPGSPAGPVPYPPLGYPPRADRPPVVPAAAPMATGYGTTISEQRIVRRGSPLELAERIVVFLFGLLQLLLVARIILLLLNAREANDLVNGIYNVTDPFVAPFRGILGQDSANVRGTYFDTVGLIALIGWSILEGIVLALIRVFRRQAA